MPPTLRSGSFPLLLLSGLLIGLGITGSLCFLYGVIEALTSGGLSNNPGTWLPFLLFLLVIVTILPLATGGWLLRRGRS